MKKGDSTLLSPERTSPQVLVAGAAGFLGSFLTEKLVDLGAQVIAVDDLSLSSPQSAAQLKSLSQCDFFRHDLTQPLPTTLTRKKFTHIVHAANVEEFLGSERIELKELLVNSMGVKHLLDLALANRARFVLTSAVEIYSGLASSQSLKHYYDGVERAGELTFREAKRYAESLCQQYVDMYDLDIRVARLPEVYGPRMNLSRNNLLARLIWLALNRKDLVVDEEGSREHRLLYIEDAAEGVLRLLLSDEKDLKQSIFSFVNPEKVSALSLAYVLREAAGLPLDIKFEPGLSASILNQAEKIDWQRARKMLSWQPRTDLTEGLQKTLEYFKGKAGYPAGLSKEAAQSKLTEAGALPLADEVVDKVKASGRARITKKSKLVGPPEEKGLVELTHGWRDLRGSLARTEVFFRPSSRWLVPGLAGVFVFLALPLIITFALGWQARSQARASLRFLAAAQTSKALSAASRSQTYLSLIQKTLNLSYPSFWLARQGDVYLKLQKLIRAGYFSLEAEKVLLSEPTLFSELSKAVSLSPTLLKQDQNQENQAGAAAGQVVEMEGLQQKLKLNLPLINQNLALARLSLCGEKQDLNECREDLLANWPVFKENELDQALRLFFAGVVFLDKAENLVPQLGDFLGYGGDKVYLILLQNNTELRATGGFIGSYALLRVKNGLIYQLEVDDIYNPEGQLKQKIPAPDPVRKYMDVAELGIRDSNWWPHFPESAAKIASLFEFAAGEKVDYVAAVNLDLIEDLLTVTGPVWVEGYGEEVNSGNLFERAEIQAEVGFEPGSTSKRDFLGAVGQGLLKRLLDLDRTGKVKLFEALARNLDQGEISVYAKDNESERSLVRAGWDGGLVDWQGDYLGVFDSNVGGNKANFWVERGLSYQVTVDREGNLTGNLEISWEHRGFSTTWPGGNYKNYLRVYLPAGSELLEEQNFADAPVVYDAFGKTVVGGLVEVPINSTKVVSLKYGLPERLNLLKNNEYKIYTQKQSGVKGTKLVFSLTLPAFLQSDQGGLIQRKITLYKNWQLSLPLRRAT